MADCSHGRRTHLLDHNESTGRRAGFCGCGLGGEPDRGAAPHPRGRGMARNGSHPDTHSAGVRRRCGTTVGSGALANASRYRHRCLARSALGGTRGMGGTRLGSARCPGARRIDLAGVVVALRKVALAHRRRIGSVGPGPRVANRWPGRARRHRLDRGDIHRCGGSDGRRRIGDRRPAWSARRLAVADGLRPGQAGPVRG